MDMRTYRLILFGRELFSWEIDGAFEVVVTTDCDATQDDDESEEISEASGQNFERDLNPRYPEAEKDYDSWIERPFGFGKFHG